MTNEVALGNLAPAVVSQAGENRGETFDNKRSENRDIDIILF